MICPYCHKEAELTDSKEIYGGRSFGMIYLCRPCDAYVSVHVNSPDFTPKGTLANKELRKWRLKTHSVFDPLWKSKKMKRKGAYALMEHILEIPKHEAHIAKLNIEQCKKLINVLLVRQGEIKSPKMSSGNSNTVT